MCSRIRARAANCDKRFRVYRIARQAEGACRWRFKTGIYGMRTGSWVLVARSEGAPVLLVVVGAAAATAVRKRAGSMATDLVELCVL
mmetsp:Transcript_4942/g.13299  ORF Transcript_4942/g.13299 Transcript_4942/m.13299 type:complete len:87 (-) Transcript_4942:404-664(-)